MILAEKIALLRRRAGLSQEELADTMKVSRQSVSKWESGAAIPDLEKVLRLSALFGVSTDFLLKDELEESALPSAPTQDFDPNAPRTVTAEEATDCLALYQQLTGRIAAAVVALILSPVPLLALLAASATEALSSSLALAAGLSALLVIVAIAVAALILTGMRLSRYSYLDQEPFRLAYGVEGVLLHRKEELAPGYRVSVALGVVLFILSFLPVTLAGALGSPGHVTLALVCLLLALVALGVGVILRAGLVYGCLDRLLQQGDYSPEEKQLEKRLEPFTATYWCLVLALYMVLSFLAHSWHITWVIWPVAAMLFVAIRSILKGIFARQKK